MTYTVTVMMTRRRTPVCVTDTATPDALRPLLRHLTLLARRPSTADQPAGSVLTALCQIAPRLGELFAHGRRGGAAGDVALGTAVSMRSASAISSPKCGLSALQLGRGQVWSTAVPSPPPA